MFLSQIINIYWFALMSKESKSLPMEKNHLKINLLFVIVTVNQGVKLWNVQSWVPIYV